MSSLRTLTGFAPTMMLHQQSRLSLSKVWMCDGEAAEEAPAADDSAVSVLDSLSAGNAEMLEKIKGLTLVEAAALIKEVDSTFGLNKDDDDDDAPAEE